MSVLTSYDHRRQDFQTVISAATAAYVMDPFGGLVYLSFRSTIGVGTVALPPLAMLPVGYKATIFDAGDNALLFTQTINDSTGALVTTIASDSGAVTVEVGLNLAGTAKQWYVLDVSQGSGGGGFAPLTNTFFVDYNKPAGGDGSIATPFNTLAAGLAACVPAQLTYLYVCAKDYSAAAPAGEGPLQFPDECIVVLEFMGGSAPGLVNLVNGTVGTFILQGPGGLIVDGSGATAPGDMILQAYGPLASLTVDDSVPAAAANSVVVTAIDATLNLQGVTGGAGGMVRLLYAESCEFTGNCILGEADIFRDCTFNTVDVDIRTAVVGLNALFENCSFIATPPFVPTITLPGNTGALPTTFQGCLFTQVVFVATAPQVLGLDEQSRQQLITSASTVPVGFTVQMLAAGPVTGELWVSSTANALGADGSYDRPFLTLAAAVAAAAASPVVNNIYVAQATYAENLVIPAELRVVIAGAFTLTGAAHTVGAGAELTLRGRAGANERIIITSVPSTFGVGAGALNFEYCSVACPVTSAANTWIINSAVSGTYTQSAGTLLMVQSTFTNLISAPTISATSCTFSAYVTATAAFRNMQNCIFESGVVNDVNQNPDFGFYDCRFQGGDIEGVGTYRIDATGMQSNLSAIVTAPFVRNDNELRVDTVRNPAGGANVTLSALSTRNFYPVNAEAGTNQLILPDPALVANGTQIWVHNTGAGALTPVTATAGVVSPVGASVAVDTTLRFVSDGAGIWYAG